MVHFLGSDVWLIPIDREAQEGDEEVTLHLKQAYVGDDWSLRNQECLGYHGEPCVIAVEMHHVHYLFAEDLLLQADTYTEGDEIPCGEELHSKLLNP